MWRGTLAGLGSPHGQVHRPDGEEREGVHLDHDGHESHVQEHLNEACGKGVQRAAGHGLGGRAGTRAAGGPGSSHL